VLGPCRQRALPLVGRRWHELANSPQLCRRLAVTLGQGKRVLDKLCSLSYWLLNSGAAGHVEQLALEMAHPGNGKGVIGETAAAQTVCGILAACGATGRLTDVHVSLNMNSGITLGSWATLALRSVRCLHITAEGAVRVTASLLPLTALEELRLEGFTQLRDPCLYQGARLPPSITHLHLGGAAFGGLPTQVPPPAAAPATGCLRNHRARCSVTWAGGPSRVSLGPVQAWAAHHILHSAFCAADSGADSPAAAVPRHFALLRKWLHKPAAADHPAMFGYDWMQNARLPAPPDLPPLSHSDG
jgi:hypothetical protein